MKLIKNILIALTVLGLAAPALGKSKREGFNFGAAIQQSSSNNVSHSSSNGGMKVSEEVATDAVHPHIGWVLGDYINFGLAMTFENTSTEATEVNSEGSETFKRKADIDLKGTSLFIRFLFAKVLYFEAGAGVYDREVETVDTLRISQNDDGFIGTETISKVRGIGTGYNLGAGMEFPIGRSGFFFTSAYNVRTYNLRDYDGNEDIGKKTGRSERRELNFGISHYLD